MKEIYRSFEGILGVDNQEGYIVFELNGMYEIHNISVWTDKKDGKFRVKDPLNWEDISEIAEACVMVENGAVEGQAFYNGKWYSTETINKIQNDHQDGNWKGYV